MKIRPVFTDRIPKTLEEGALYISEKYSTAAHNCFCGCGVKIVTPLKPGQWSLIRRGDKVSISPSIGNWSSACQSHYWIEGNEIRWSASFSKAAIKANRAGDRRALERAFAERRKLWNRLVLVPWAAIKDSWAIFLKWLRAD